MVKNVFRSKLPKCDGENFIEFIKSVEKNYVLICKNCFKKVIDTSKRNNNQTFSNKDNCFYCN